MQGGEGFCPAEKLGDLNSRDLPHTFAIFLLLLDLRGRCLNSVLLAKFDDVVDFGERL